MENLRRGMIEMAAGRSSWLGGGLVITTRIWTLLLLYIFTDWLTIPWIVAFAVLHLDVRVQ
jgi:hypothetical protein